MDHSYDMTEHPGIYVGATFSSLAEFQAALTRYTHKTNTVYNISKSQCMQNCHKTGVNDLGYKTKFAPLSPKLKYMYVMYGCKHYGKARSKSRGIRPNQKTFKTGCPSHIALTTDRKRGLLVVKTAVLHHNHHLGPDMARLYPENRRLPGSGRKPMAVHVRRLPRDAKTLRQTMLANSRPGDTEATVFKPPPSPPSATADYDGEGEMEDYSPPSPFHPADKHESFVSLEEFAGVLREEFDCCRVEEYRPDGEFAGLLVQDADMVAAFDAFPEYLCVDRTSTLLHSAASVVLLAAEDSAGKSETVALAVLLSDDDAAIGWLLATFKERNEASARTKILFNNGPSEQGEVLQHHFPSSRLLLNPALCLRAWKRHVPRGITGVTEEGEDLAHHLLSRALNAASASAYAQVHSEMVSALPPDVLSYYDATWHAIREQWTLGVHFRPDIMQASVRLFERFKRRLGLRSVDNPVPDFFRRFFVELAHLRREDRLASVKSKMQSYATEVMPYASLLTPYALSLVSSQHDLVVECRPFDYIDNADASSHGAISVPVTSCACPFFQSMSLPCRHVFVRRQFLGLDAFDAGLCAERWTKDYYLAATGRRQATATGEGEGADDATLNTVQRIRRATEITSELASLLATSTGDRFAKRASTLRRLLTAWRRDKDVTIAQVGDDVGDRPLQRDGVYGLLGTEVERYVDGQTLTEGGGMFVGEEVEVVIVHADEDDGDA